MVFYYYSTLLSISFWKLLIILINHILNCAAFVFLFLNLAHVLALYYTTSSTLMMIFYIRIQQTYEYLFQLLNKLQQNQKSMKLNLIPERRLNVFRTYYNSCLQLLQSINDACATLFFAFFCSAAPSNAAFVGWLIRDRLSLIDQIFMGFFTLYQLYIMMIIHLCISRIAGHIRRPNWLLRSMAVLLNSSESFSTKRKSIFLRFRLAVSHQIFAIDSKKQHSFVYGKHFGRLNNLIFYTDILFLNIILLAE